MKKKKIYASSFSFIILGIANALAEKLLYEQEAIGDPNRQIHKFTKPFFFATTLFFGVSLSLIGYIILSFSGKKGYPRISKFGIPLFLQFIIPGFFDLFQGVMSSITCAFIGVSIDYMLRSATLVGVSLISHFYFKRVFRPIQVIGVIIVTLSLLLVGLSSIISADISSTIHVEKKWAILIIILKLLSQSTYSIELSLDEYYTQKKGVPIMLVSGYQSFWAFIIGFFILLPISHYLPGEDGKGLHEDIKDTFLMLKNNNHLVLILSICVLIESVYQISSISLTNSTSALVRTLVESFRTFLLWLIQLFIFYGFKGMPSLEYLRGVGEEWSKGSLLQLFAFSLLLVGLLLYKGTPKNYPLRKKRKSDSNDKETKTFHVDPIL